MLAVILALVIAVCLFIHALLLHLVTKIFKVEKANFQTALKISIFEWLLLIVIGLVVVFALSALKLPVLLSDLVQMVVGFFILHWLLKKYYSTKIKKNLLIYVVLTVILVALSLIATIPIRLYVMQPFYASSQSMEPTLEKGEYMFIKIYDRDYKRGDIVVYENPNDQKENFIHRIVGLPGEKLQIKDGRVYIFDDRNPDGYELPESYLPENTETKSENQEIIDIDNNKYFILGDNRGSSLYSRSIGLVDKGLIVGKYWISPPLR